MRWDIQKLHLLWFLKENKSYICTQFYITFYSCIYFQEFVNVSLISKKDVGSCNLTGLWDSTDYSVAIRCVNNESAFWSGWSGEKNGSTEEKGKLPTCISFLLSYFDPLEFSRKNLCFSVLSSIELRILLLKQNMCILFQNRRGKLKDNSEYWRRFVKWFKQHRAKEENRWVDSEEGEN